jgi:hypothetical protein
LPKDEPETMCAVTNARREKMEMWMSRAFMQGRAKRDYREKENHRYGYTYVQITSGLI